MLRGAGRGDQEAGRGSPAAGDSSRVSQGMRKMTGYPQIRCYIGKYSKNLGAMQLAVNLSLPKSVPIQNHNTLFPARMVFR